MAPSRSSVTGERDEHRRFDPPDRAASSDLDARGLLGLDARRAFEEAGRAEPPAARARELGLDFTMNPHDLLSAGGGPGLAPQLKILAILTLLSLLPAIVLTMRV